MPRPLPANVAPRDGWQAETRRPAGAQAPLRGIPATIPRLRRQSSCASEGKTFRDGGGSGELLLVNQVDCFHEDVAIDAKAVRADFVHGVLRGVVVAVVGAVVEVY